MVLCRALSLRCAVWLVAALVPAAAMGQADGRISSDDRSSSTRLMASLPDAPGFELQQASPSPGQTEAERREQQRAEGAAEVKQQEQQRVLGVIPQFNVVRNGHAVPLTPGQKFSLMLHSSKDLYTIGYAFVGAGFNEITSTNDGFGWGAKGYFWRVGSNYADTVDGAFLGNAVLPILLHQDPRYFRKGTGSIKSRFLHAALSTVICKGDNGKTQFNYSNVLGNYLAGGISNLYYPSQQRGAGLAFSNGTTVTLFGAVGGQLLEFAPDIVGLMKKRHGGAAPAATPQP